VHSGAEIKKTYTVINAVFYETSVAAKCGGGGLFFTKNREFARFKTECLSLLDF
jgi:hypothetical protein